MKLIPYYIIAFIEGSSLMGLQLLASRIIATTHGVTLMVWSILIGITLFGLALGYFTGGYYSKNTAKLRKMILTVLILSTVFSFAFPFFGRDVVGLFLSLPAGAGLMLFCLFFIMPVVFLFGMVSPLLIELIAQKSPEKIKGSLAGRLYAVSTFGGIVGTFLFGLYFIPLLGVKAGIVIMASTLAVASVLMFRK